MIRVAIIAFEGMSLFHLSVPIAIFADAPAQNTTNNTPLFEVTVCAESEGAIRSANGLGLQIEHNTAAISEADIIIVPSWNPDTPPSTPLTNALIHAHQQHKRIVGLCLGAYALAYCGLLDGKRATTHWRYGDDFAAKFPNVCLDINPLYIAQDNLITSAGTAAAIDCCLHLVKQVHGTKVANSIARLMVSSPQRSGGQKQYIENPTLKRPSDERMAKLIDLVLDNLTEAFPLERAAEICMMSVRSFSRNFKAANGISFTSWLINERLNHSLWWLESSSVSITKVAERCGFSSEQIYRKHFQTRYGTSPKAWQTQFKSGATS